MSKKHFRNISMGGLVGSVLLLFLLFINDEVHAAWVFRDSSAVNLIAVCRDGVYMGVGHDGSLVGENINVTFTLQPGGQVIASEDFVPPPSSNPGDPPYAGYYYLYWDAAYQPLSVGAVVETDALSPQTVADCLVDPEDVPASTTFTYQGRLDEEGNAVNGVYDFRFRLFNEAGGGRQVGPTVWKEDVTVTNGLFTLELDFGGETFNGHARWLQIGVRPGPDTGNPTVLSPRQPLTAVPIAHTLRAGAVISGSLPDQSILRLKNNIGNALQIESGFYGVQVQSAAEAGIIVESSVVDGIRIESAGQYGLEVSNTGSSAITVYSPGDSGLTVSGAGGDGVAVYSPDSSGFYAGSPANSGLSVYSAGDDGVNVYSATDDGLAVSYAGNDGLYIFDAGDDGIDISTAATNGLYIGTAGYKGVYVNAPVSDGLWVSSAGSDGIDVAGTAYAGAFYGDIYVSGSCVGCLMAQFGVNTSDTELLPGDVVTLRGLQANPYGGLAILPEVGPAQSGQAILGVVQGTAEVDQVEEPRPGQPAQRLVPREGTAVPGAYITIVTHGVMQVNVPASDQPILAGSRLTVSENGQLRALLHTEVNGIRLEEDLPVVGTALEALSAGQAGLIWVLVSPH